jgi:uncharacterized Fe-S center protein
MPNSQVYFTPAKDKSQEELANKLPRLFDEANLKSTISKGDLVAIKLHFGEPGNTAYLKPHFVKKVVKIIKQLGAKPFLTDTNVLYKSRRMNSVDHLNAAAEHGYTQEKIGCPIIIADGLHGQEYVKVDIGQKHFKEVNIASAIHHADAMVALTHFKGHELSGFGGTIKNIGMGSGSRSGKQQMHADVRPEVYAPKCTRCSLCIKWCPTQAISYKTIGESTAFIDKDKCIGCAECIVVCDYGAIAVSWDGSSASMQEKMVEYMYGVVKDKPYKMSYLNFILEVSPNCDCYGHNGPPVVPDIGVMASLDPVALDQSSIEAVNKAAGKDIFREIYPSVDWEVQLKYAEELIKKLKLYVPRAFAQPHQLSTFDHRVASLSIQPSKEFFGERIARSFPDGTRMIRGQQMTLISKKTDLISLSIFIVVNCFSLRHFAAPFSA